MKTLEVVLTNKNQEEIEEALNKFSKDGEKLAQVKYAYDELEHTLTVGLNNLMQEQLKEIRKVKNKLRKIEETNATDTVAVRKEIVGINKIKENIKQEIMSLNSRIENAEINIGCE